MKSLLPNSRVGRAVCGQALRLVPTRPLHCAPHTSPRRSGPHPAATSNLRTGLMEASRAQQTGSSGLEGTVASARLSAMGGRLGPSGNLECAGNFGGEEAEEGRLFL